MQPSRVRGRTIERQGELGRRRDGCVDPTATTAAERVLLLRPVLGPDGRLQPRRQVAQDHGSHKQQTSEDAGQREERAAVVLGRHRATVVDVLGHDHCVLDVLLKLGVVGRVRRLVVRRRVRQLGRAVGAHVPPPSPVPGRLEQVQTVFLETAARQGFSIIN